MKSRIITLIGLFIILSSTNMSLGNPGGNEDGNRDFTCVGSCHGDPSLSQVSEGKIFIDSNEIIFAGTAVSINVNVSLESPSKENLLGIFLLSSLNGNGDQPNDHGWKIIQDPNGGINNYVEIKIPNSGNVILTWILTAPLQIGEQNLYIQINHGKLNNPDNLALTGVSEAHNIKILSTPENLPGFSDTWTAPKYRISGDNSPLIINTKNTNQIMAKWKLEGDNTIHQAQINSIDENSWEVFLPFTTGDIEIKYMITTYNDDFPVEQPWLTIGTIPPTFEGSLFGARLQAFAFTCIITGFIISLQSAFKSQNNKKQINSKESKNENIEAKLIRSSEYPGWLWDAVAEKWIPENDNNNGDS